MDNNATKTESHNVGPYVCIDIRSRERSMLRFLQAVMNHNCSLPSQANDHERENAVSFLGTIFKLFQLILSTGNVLATRVLPVDALCGTTRRLTTQEMRFLEVIESQNDSSSGSLSSSCTPLAHS